MEKAVTLHHQPPSFNSSPLPPPFRKHLGAREHDLLKTFFSHFVLLLFLLLLLLLLRLRLLLLRAVSLFFIFAGRRGLGIWRALLGKRRREPEAAVAA